MRTHDRWSALPGLALAVAACAGCAQETPDPALAGSTHVYTCAADFRFSARMRADTAFIALPTRAISLPQRPAASGARYAADDVTFWTKGREASLETATDSYTNCAGRSAGTPWDEARLLGTDFRAIGQEPGWTLEIDTDRWMRFTTAYGQQRVYMPVPEQAGDPDRDWVTYVATTEAHTLDVTIEPTPCQDTMSGEAFTHTVRVRLDGTEYHGCGRTLVAG